MRIEPDAEGRIVSEELGIALRLLGSKLVMSDLETGEVLLTEAERAARETAEATAAALEVALNRLRERLRREVGDGE